MRSTKLNTLDIALSIIIVEEKLANLEEFVRIESIYRLIEEEKKKKKS